MKVFIIGIFAVDLCLDVVLDHDDHASCLYYISFAEKFYLLFLSRLESLLHSLNYCYAEVGLTAGFVGEGQISEVDDLLLWKVLSRDEGTRALV